MSLHIIRLDTMELGGDFKRDHPKLHSEDFEQGIGEFDHHTLFYDIVIKNNLILIYCPKLLNFEEIIRKSNFSIDGKSVKFKLKKFSRFDLIKIKSNGTILNISNQIFSKQWSLKKFDTNRFEKMNCLVTLNKNNKLEWISDFVKFHIKYHNLDCILLFDNGSSSYTTLDLESCLHKTGIKDYLIVTVPQPYGIISKSKNRCFSFLQPTLLNLAREKFFSDAGAVLSVDIDELVWKKEKSIFELAKSSFFGFVLFRGQWRFSKSNSKLHKHKDHKYIANETLNCPTKYCYTPNGISRWIPLSVHRLHPKRTHLRNLINYLLETNDAGYWHCQSISTNWKPNRILKNKNLKVDEKFISYF